MVSPQMNAIGCPHQAAPGLGKLSSQEPQHTSEMLPLYQIGPPIQALIQQVWGWRENGRKEGKEGKRKGEKFLLFNVIEFTNILHMVWILFA